MSENNQEKKWQNKSPNDADLYQIIVDHKHWLEREGKKSPPEDLTGIDLHAPDAGNQPFHYRRLEGADLTGAILNGADFSNNTHLIGVVFNKAQLQNVNFSGCKLVQAKFVGANLSGSDFSQADLAEAYFTGANLAGAKLVGSKLNHTCFNNGILDNAVLDRANGHNTIFDGATLGRTSYVECELEESSFKKVQADSPCFVKAKLGRADFSFSTLNEANFSEVKMGNSLIKSVKGNNIQFLNTIMVESQFGDSKFSGSDFSGAHLEGSDLSNANFPACNFAGAFLERSYMRRSNFLGAKFTWADLSNAQGNESNFNFSDLRSANCSGSEFRSAIFNNAKMSSVVFENAMLEGAIFLKADIQSGNFQHASLQSVDLDNADLNDADFFEASLRAANLKNAVVTGVNFEGVRGLSAIQLAGLDLSSAVLPDRLLKSQALDSAIRAAGYARKLFTPLAFSCIAFSFFALWSEETTRKLKVPLLGFELPEKVFAYLAPILLVFLYTYFLYYLTRVWETYSRLPAVFPDESPLNRYPDPWLLINAIRLHLPKLKRKTFDLRAIIASFMIWWMTPISLVIILIGDWRFDNRRIATTIFGCLVYSCLVSANHYLETRTILQNQRTHQVIDGWHLCCASLAFILIITIAGFILLFDLLGLHATLHPISRFHR